VSKVITPVIYAANDCNDLANQLIIGIANVEIKPVELLDEDKSGVYLLLNENSLTAYVDGFKPFNVHQFYSEFIVKRRAILNKELLLGAVGYAKLKDYNNLSVLDMTGGLGRDAILFALAGFNVTVVENNPYLTIILRYLQESFASILFDFRVVHGNSHQLLQTIDDNFDFIYYDPMFEDGKNALAKKDMQLIDKFIEFSGSLNDEKLTNEEILKLALSKSHKFIVKRDNKQATLAAKPTYQKLGKTIRFDVYQGLQKLPSE
jgi:16S rRNA (guanine1516-N2)-methyltransferase